MKLLNISIFVLLLVSITTIADGGYVGINYGRLGNNLPPPQEVVKLIKKTGFTHAKIFDVNRPVLKAFAGSGIKLIVCLPNENITVAANNPTFANKWVTNHIVPAHEQKTHITAIAVGNEVLDDKKNTGLASNLVRAMENIHNALVAHNLDHAIKVSSPLSSSALGNSYPPTAGEFNSKFVNIITSMLSFLSKTKSPFMMNVYPYFAYIANQKQIPLEYALGQAPNVVAGIKYPSLFVSMVDAIYSAKKKLNFDSVPLLVTETGWPSDGNPGHATTNNAAAYNFNLVKHVLNGGGTPTRPNANFNVYIFALFNENEKTDAATEQHFGLFFPNMRKVYGFVLHGHGGGGATDDSENGGMAHMPIDNENTKAVPTDENQLNTNDFNVPMKEEVKPNPHTNGHGSPNGAGGRESWCVAKKTATHDSLQKGLDWVCTRSVSGGDHCSMIQIGNKCFEPNNLLAHASHAFNHYYQMNKHAPGTCNFDGAAHIVSKQRPRYGNCPLFYKAA